MAWIRGDFVTFVVIAEADGIRQYVQMEAFASRSPPPSS